MRTLTKLYIVALLTGALLFTIGCKSDTTAESGEAGTEHSDNAEGVSLTPEQEKNIGLQTGPITSRPLSGELQVNGMLTLPPEGKAEISPMVGGLVKSIAVKEGQAVRAGQTLLVLEHPDIIQVQEDYLKSRSRLQFLEKDLKRQRDLGATGVNAGKTLELAIAEEASESAHAKALEKRLRLIGIDPVRLNAGNLKSTLTLTAPISGYVRAIHTNLGTFAGPNQPVMEILNPDHLHADLQLFERDFAGVSEGQEVRFTVNGMPDESFRGRIFSVGKSFEGEARTVPLHAEILEDVHHRLIPGMYVTAWLHTGRTAAQVVPDAALVREGNKIFVFVPGSKPHTYALAEVKTGRSEDSFTEVLPVGKGGLPSLIVTQGAYELMSVKRQAEGGEE